MTKLTFPYEQKFIIFGSEGPRWAIVTFIEKGEKLAVDVLWKGRMPENFEEYDRSIEERITKFLETNGIEIGKFSAQDFGKDKEASKKAIDEFLNGQTNHEPSAN